LNNVGSACINSIQTADFGAMNARPGETVKIRKFLTSGIGAIMFMAVRFFKREIC